MSGVAPGQMQGYIYQVQASLLHFLKNMATFSDDTLIRLENFDDVDFSSTPDDPKAILQTKHSQNPGRLTDGSKDLWKTLFNWISFCNTENLWQQELPLFYLITTDEAAEKSIAWHLMEEHRDVAKALTAINAVVAKNSNTVKSYSINYTLLSDTQKNKLLKKIYVIPSNSNGENIETEIKSHLLNGGVLPQSSEDLRGGLINWWYGESIRSLSKKTQNLSKKMFESKLQEFQSKNGKKLLIDKNYPKNTPHHTYLKQLDIINYQTQIENARDQFCCAFHNRGSWLKSGMVTDTALQGYSDKLFKEWEGQRASSGYNNQQDDPSKGQFLYDQCVVNYKSALLPLCDCTEPELLQGSYQILAEDQTIGWHPDYKNKL